MLIVINFEFAFNQLLLLLKYLLFLDMDLMIFHFALYVYTVIGVVCFKLKELKNYLLVFCVVA